MKFDSKVLKVLKDAKTILIEYVKINLVFVFVMDYLVNA